GAGGVGKTRLSIEAASRAGQECASGAAWVELAPLADPDLILPAIAGALGVPEAGIGAAEGLLLRIADHLSEKPLLLAIDNCEHLIGPAAEVVESLLQAAPALRILATSRERLGISGEVVWRVPSLPCPGEELVMSDDWSNGQLSTLNSQLSTLNSQLS